MSAVTCTLPLYCQGTETPLERMLFFAPTPYCQGAEMPLERVLFFAPSPFFVRALNETPLECASCSLPPFLTLYCQGTETPLECVLFFKLLYCEGAETPQEWVLFFAPSPSIVRVLKRP